MKAVLLVAGMCLLADIAYAHGGGLNAAGCHNERRTGGYHCHRSSYTPPAPKFRNAPAVDSYVSNTRARSRFTLANKDQIYAAQTLLKRAGCGLEIVDGKFGPETETAIKKFQAAQNLAVTGDVDDRLIADLVRVIDVPDACE